MTLISRSATSCAARWELVVCRSWIAHALRFRKRESRRWRYCVCKCSQNSVLEVWNKLGGIKVVLSFRHPDIQSNEECVLGFIFFLACRRLHKIAQGMSLITERSSCRMQSHLINRHRILHSCIHFFTYCNGSRLTST